MEHVILGNSGIEVSKLCFGALTIGPLQAKMSVEDGARVLAYALERGVSFVDTAELYKTYAHIKRAIEISGRVPVITSKTYAYDRRKAEASLEKARKEMNLDAIDIFLLHEQESRYTIKGHMEAMEYFCEAKQKGLIKAFGVSTHNVEMVRAGAEIEEIDIIHPIVNRTGIGIGDGSIDQMLEAISMVNSRGKGIYAMKPLGGGHLIGSYEDCLNFVLDNKAIHSIAVGMQSIEEVDANIEFFENRHISEELKMCLQKKKRNINVDPILCKKCGKCVERCASGALKMGKAKAEADMSKCIFCGYCGSVCPEFAIRIV